MKQVATYYQPRSVADEDLWLMLCIDELHLNYPCCQQPDAARSVRPTRSEGRTQTRRIRILPPIAKQKLYPALMLTVLHATEPDTPEGRDRIDWKLVTNLPVRWRKDAIEKLNWYAMRWKIETFDKILKSGFKAEVSG